ncbi:hypothetical protein LINPERHAP2_LOCUS21181 [Linum perenne]
MHCLDLFCGTSEQSISKEKSVVYFSKNVSNNRRTKISRVLGIPVTTNPGKYLDIPVLHGPAIAANFVYILENG